MSQQYAAQAARVVAAAMGLRAPVATGMATLVSWQRSTGEGETEGETEAERETESAELDAVAEGEAEAEKTLRSAPTWRLWQPY